MPKPNADAVALETLRQHAKAERRRQSFRAVVIVGLLLGVAVLAAVL